MSPIRHEFKCHIRAQCDLHYITKLNFSGSDVSQDSKSDASGSKATSREPSSVHVGTSNSGAPTTGTSAQPKTKQQSSAQAGADQTSVQAGSDKPKGALKFRDSGRGKKGSKKPQLELDSGKGDLEGTVGDRLDLNLLHLKF